ncbi:MAG: acyltransferase family protein [Oscillospiraceae bacterium]
MESINTGAPKGAQRVSWVDIAKCIGIVAIVLGHTIQGGYLKKYVYSFHIPMFFFLQGTVFSISHANDQQNFFTYLKHRSKSLLVPYYFFAIISTAAIMVASHFIALPDRANISSPTQLIWEILSGYCDANRPLWFLPCSFLMSIFGFACISVANKLRNPQHRLWFLLGIAFFCALLLYINDSFAHVYNLFWKADTAVEMLPFFLFGYLAMECRCNEMLLRVPKGIKIGVSITFIFLGALSGLWNDEAGYLGNYYGYISVFNCSAMLSIAGYLILAMLLPPFEMLVYVGQSTLPILLLHKFLITIFQYLIPYTKKKLLEHSVIVGIGVSAMAIAFCCIVQEILRRLCPILIGRSKEAK